MRINESVPVRQSVFSLIINKYYFMQIYYILLRTNFLYEQFSIIVAFSLKKNYNI
jgi:hypothetical protein